MEGSTGVVRIVSRRTVQPEFGSSPDGAPPEPAIMHLTPWDLQYISVDYIQKGVLLPEPRTGGARIADDLAASFARALGCFYPLDGRLAVDTGATGGAPDSGPGLVVSLCCRNEGAEIIHAEAREVTASDITAPFYTPSAVVRSFFPLNGLLCGDAALDSRRPVLAAQVTKLADGVFVAVSLNHAVADGATFWHFLSTWSEIHRGDGRSGELSAPRQELGRWFPDTCPVPVTLPFGKLEDAIRRVEYPPVRECFFHLSGESVKRLKVRANNEMAGTATATATISSLQALLAHLWRAACRARGALAAAGDHLPPAHRMPGTGEGRRRVLRGQCGGHRRREVHRRRCPGPGAGLDGVAADEPGRGVVRRGEQRDTLSSWHRKPNLLHLEAVEDPADIVLAGSPRFDVYGNDFGWGQPVTVRSGAGNKMDGVVTVYAGRCGGGSVALEVCMSPEALARLAADEEFMEAVSTA